MKMVKRGRPSKRTEEKKSESLYLRVEMDEKESFKKAAEIAGIPLSAWIRERLRRCTITELEGGGHSISFLKKIKME